MRLKINRALKICLLFIICLVFIPIALNIHINAKEFDISSIDLYNLTNTYKYKLNEDKNPFQVSFDNDYRYELDKTTNEIVDSGAPLLTVLTHGLGGDASHWSNKKENGRYKFAYSKDSVISKLAMKQDCNIYWARIDKTKKLNLFNITNQVYNGLMYETNEMYNKNEIKQITDISKHSIVVFEADEFASDGGNDDVYTEFNYAISKIVYDIKILNNNKLPKMNLIGHSRGGITNMQYALDHPDMVDSIFSLGTPYLGTTSGSLGYCFKDIIGYNPLCTDDAARDLLHSEVYFKYMNRWNDGYDKYYKNITVHAYAGLSGFNNLYTILVSEETWPTIFSDFDSWNPFAKEGIMVAAISCLFAVYGAYQKRNTISDEIIRQSFEAFRNIQPDSSFEREMELIIDICNLMLNELKTIGPNFVFCNDFCVDMGSALGYVGEYVQLGKAYKGFNHHVKVFAMGNCNYNAKSANFPAVAHNLESRDSELCNQIISEINLGITNEKYIVETVYDENGYETDDVYVCQYLGVGDIDTLVIPEIIEGKTVVGISNYAFANNVYGKNNIRKIVVPDSVKEIGENAFYNSDFIEEICFSKDSFLERISDNAFSNMPSLKEIYLPRNVNEIGDSAFLNSGIEKIESDSNRFEWKNDLLVDKNVLFNGSWVSKAVFVNSNCESIKMPDDAKFIGNELFLNNNRIKTVDLNKVQYIGNNAFLFSSLETVNGGEYIETVENNAFYGTPWFHDLNSEQIKIGNTLISAKSDSDIIEIDNQIKRVSKNCVNSVNVKGIIIGENVESIGINAFSNCPNLEWIMFKSTKKSFLDGEIVSSNIPFYVSKNKLEEYKKWETFGSYRDNIMSKSVKVIFADGNNSELYFDYGETFNVDEPESFGYDFKGWIVNGENEIIKPYDLFLYYADEIVLTPKYEKTKYFINISIFDNPKDIVIEYGDFLKAAEVDGYIFQGWYNLSNEKVIDEEGNVDYTSLKKNDILVANYVPIDYKATIINTDKKYIFNVKKKLNSTDIEEPIKFGYVFDYWKYGDKTFENSEGIFEDITLMPVFKGTIYEFKGDSYSHSTIGDKYSVIDLENAKIDSSYEIRINSNVLTVAFLGYSKTFNSFRIIIEKRDKALVLGLSNIIIKAPQAISNTGYNTIECKSNADIYVNIEGNVTIYGGEAGKAYSYLPNLPQADDNKDGVEGCKGVSGYSGGCGICVNSLIIDGASKGARLIVIGGKGGKGGTGQNGQKGSNGVNPPSGWFMHSKKGDNGSNGGIGGQGGDGGKGGYAIKVDGEDDLKISEYINYIFRGGTGGTGGQGGKGGSGGNGASDTSSNIFTGVGDPGDGGNGGAGGKGGTGGDGSDATNALNIEGHKGYAGIGGDGGLGGDAGLGGNAGDCGNDGEKGKNGNEGNVGELGTYGAFGKDSKETKKGIKNTGYMFKKQFLNTLY